MKKCLFLLFCIPFLFSGCGRYYTLKSKISEYRACLFYLKSEDFVATFTSGKREKEFYYNGVSTTLVPYGVIAVKYLSDVPIDEKREYMLLIDSLQYTGELEYNPIDGTFVADIGKEMSKDSDIYLRLWGGGITDQAYMECVSKTWIDYKAAFKTATEHMKSKLKPYIKSGKLNGEFFIKFVGERALENVSYYIQFVGEDKKSFVCLIDVYSGKVTYTKGL